MGLTSDYRIRVNRISTTRVIIMITVASVSVSGSKKTRRLGEELRKCREDKMLKDSLLGSVILKCYFSIRLYSCII